MTNNNITTGDTLKQGMLEESKHKKFYNWLSAYFNKYQKMPPFQEWCMQITIDHLLRDGLYYEKLSSVKPEKVVEKKVKL